MMRPSTEATVKSAANTLAILVVGVILLLGGLFFLYVEMEHPPTHNGHVYTFVGMAVLGALLIIPTAMFAVFQRVSVLIGPYVPTFGRRIGSGEVPPPPAQPPTEPTP